MSDWIEKDGKKYYPAGMLLSAIKSAERRGDEVRSLKGDRENLAMIVRRLARLVPETTHGTTVVERALDYLERKGLSGSPSREKTAT